MIGLTCAGSTSARPRPVRRRPARRGRSSSWSCRRGGEVGPFELDLGWPRLDGVDVVVVLDDVDLGERLGADQVDGERGLGVGGELVAHEVLAAADVGDDVVGRAVDVAALHRLEDRLARSVFDPDVAVADVGRDVVAGRTGSRAGSPSSGRSETKPNGRQPPIGVVSAGAPRRAGHLVVLAAALVDLDDRLDLAGRCRASRCPCRCRWCGRRRRRRTARR